MTAPPSRRAAALVAGLAAVLAMAGATAAQETKIVGSSTLSKLAAIVQHRLAEDGVQVTIETTGTSGGFALFCNSDDPTFAPVALASRRIEPLELAECRRNELGAVNGFDLGLSGVVIAQHKRKRPIRLGLGDLFLALAAETPAAPDNCAFVKNPHARWSDIRDDLPDWRIEVFGPPMTSGTRASFIHLAMEAGAEKIPCMKALKERDRGAFTRAASTLRADGAWIDAGENDNVIIAALRRMPQTVGVIGYPLYQSYEDVLSAAAVDGVTPGVDTISNGAYPLSRVLRVYAKEDALSANLLARSFFEEITSPGAIGENGYLKAHGLVPIAPPRVEIDPLCADSVICTKDR